MVQRVKFIADGKTISVDRRVVEVSQYVRKLLQNLVDDDSYSDVESDNGEGIAKTSNGSKDSIEIPIENIPYETLELVLRWCTHYYETRKDEITSVINININERNPITNSADWSDNIMDDYQSSISDVVLDIWERDFLDVDAETLKQIILASNFLDIKPLLDAACKVVAEIFRGKSPTEILDAFGLLNVSSATVSN
jgi:S-phase kinase-associated protein 1